MTRSQARECDKLQRQYQRLEEDWNYMNSIPRHRHSRSIADLPATTPDLLSLLDSSPKKLIVSLQRSPSEGSNSKTSDRAVEELLTERRAAIKSGRLRGRRLLDALESAKDEKVYDYIEEVCSVCSSALIQSGAVEGSSCSCSCSCSLAEESGYGGSGVYSTSSYSPPYLCMKNLEKKKETVAMKNSGGGRWMMITMCCLAAVLMLVVPLGIGTMILSKEFGAEDFGNHMIPT